LVLGFWFLVFGSWFLVLGFHVKDPSLSLGISAAGSRFARARNAPQVSQMGGGKAKGASAPKNTKGSA
jgi:hypothetical protein